MLRFLRRAVTVLLIAALVLIPVAGGLAVQTRPSVVLSAPPDAAAAARARDVARTFRGVVGRGATRGDVTVSLAEINAVLASLSRVSPGLGGAGSIAGDQLTLELSAALWPETLWANLDLRLASSDDGPRVVSARIGHLPIPPAVVVPALRLALDAYLGAGLGGQLIDAVKRVRIGDGEISVAFALDEADRAAVYRQVKNQVRAFAGGTDADRIHAHLRAIDRAGDERRLPRGGSVLPYLRHVAGAAKGDDPEELKAALLALTLYCGEDAFGPAVGASLGPGMRGKRNNCDGTTLGGRDDLKRHFIVSAGIYAARTGTIAFGMGELKELLDSNAGGSGFSFDDMAADLAGARFAQALIETPAGDWPALLAGIGTEADLMPSLDDLPSGLTEAEFIERFGDVDSPAYAAEIAEINRRLDAMPLYAPR